MNFIEYNHLPSFTLEKTYDSSLVVLSIIIAIISSFTFFASSERIRACQSTLNSIFWLIFGATTLGIGIWAMHFIGSLALKLPVSISYNLTVTLLSVIPLILASAVVLWLINQIRFSLTALIGSGFVFGLGISIMHYMGMAAMELNANMLYLKPVFILSVVIAVVFSTVSLRLIFKSLGHKNYQLINKKQMISSTSMGLTIALTHYIGMYAVIFIPANDLTHVTTGVDSLFLSGMIAFVVALILLLALIFPHMLRYRQMIITLQNNEEELKIAAISFETHEAIMVTDRKAKIIRVNKAFSRITGYSEVEVIGMSPSLLQSGKHDRTFYRNCRSSVLNEGKWSGEVWHRRKSGEIFPEWQTISAVKDTQGKITHFVSFFSDITEFKLAEKEIEKLAFYDVLTELPNRRLLHDRLEHELNIAKRYSRAGIILFLDLDRFKHINDSLGHSVGDQLLVETAKRLQTLLRDSDTAVRLGGDEFVVLVSAQDGIHTDLLEQSNVIADKILNSINTPFIIGEHELFISTSIGITLYTGIDETVELLLKRADTAMYQAKEAGRNTFRFYNDSMQEAADFRLNIEKNLRTAILKDEFSIYYQPQLSDANVIIGVEALIRWKNAELGSVSPVDFIPIAEETGLIISIGEWVISTVCQQIKIWDKQNYQLPHVAINISAKQFHQVDFVSSLVHTVFNQHVSAKRIVLEVTESVFLGSLDEAIDKMNALKKHGFSFSIDDFGTGYSSLTYLKRLPFDQLKIDQSFVKGMVDSPADAAIVKAIVLMAKSMGLKLIAEGVETDQHLAYLSGFGCNEFQGYFFSKPLPANQLTAYLIKHANVTLALVNKEQAPNNFDN